METIWATIGGIRYNVEVDIEDNYVTCVYKVFVMTEEGLQAVDMTEEEKETFYEYYEDQLNEAYQEHLVAIKEQALEDKWERQHGR